MEALLPPDGGGGTALPGMQPPAQSGGSCQPANPGGLPQLALTDVVRFEWDHGLPLKHLNGLLSGGDAHELALATAYDEAEDRECSNILLALSGQPGASVTSRGSGTTTARPSVHSRQAAPPPTTVPVPVVAVAAQFGFPIAPAAAGAFMGPAARETALPPSRLYAIGSQPVIDLPSATYRALGSGAGGRAAPSDLDAGWGSSFGSSRPIGLARGFEHVALPSAPHGLLGNLLQPTAGSMRSQGMHGGCAALPLSLHGSGLPAGAHNNLLQLAEPPAGDLAEEERRMAQIDESAAGARLRFEAFCRPLDSLAQPCCSSGGGVGAAPALQLSDAATARQQSWPAPHKVGQSGHLVEVQQPDERQPVQHAQQGQQQQHGQQPPQRPSSPLAQPSCAANGSGRACPQPPHSPHAGQEGCSLRACGADEEAAAGEAQPNQGRQPARKRKYEASQLTLQIFEEEGCFDMDQNKAATHLGFGSATMIKKQMKKLGLQDWPYRKRSTRKTMVENAELFIEAKAALHCKPDMQAKAAVLLAYVRQLYATAVANPLGLCSTNCPGRNKNGLTQDEERFRQALYKLRDEAHKIEEQGRWGYHLQQVLERHCRELGIATSCEELDSVPAGPETCHAAAQSAPPAKPAAKRSAAQPAGRSRQAQRRRTSRKAH